VPGEKPDLRPIGHAAATNLKPKTLDNQS